MWVYTWLHLLEYYKGIVSIYLTTLARLLWRDWEEKLWKYKSNLNSSSEIQWLSFLANTKFKKNIFFSSFVWRRNKIIFRLKINENKIDKNLEQKVFIQFEEIVEIFHSDPQLFSIHNHTLQPSFWINENLKGED